MESTTILRDYLISRSKLGNIVSYDQFRKHFPEDVSQRQVRELYGSLTQQRQDVLLPVTDQIELFLDIPIQNTPRPKEIVVNDVMGIRSISNITRRLQRLAEILEFQDSSYSAQIRNLIAESRSIIEELSDLRYGRNAKALERGPMELKHEANLTILKLQAHLN